MFDTIAFLHIIARFPHVIDTSYRIALINIDMDKCRHSQVDKNKTESLKSRKRGEQKLKRCMVIKVN